MAFFRQDPQLEQLGDRLISDIQAAFSALDLDQLALTWLLYDEPVPVNTGGALTPEEFWKYQVRGFSYRGSAGFHPASIVKLFYLVAAHEWLEKEMIPPSAELERAMRDMIVDSSNDATSLVVDILTGTTSGPELQPGPFETWKYQREIINRYWRSLNWSEFNQINTNQKTWNDDYYGRERIFVGEQMENRNVLTTEATAKLLHSIVGGVAVSSRRSQSMMSLLERSLDSTHPDQDEDQVQGFLGEGLPSHTKLWSKAGWTSQVRHDAAYVEVEGRSPFLLVVFTAGRAQSRDETLFPWIGQWMVNKLVGELM
jgi:hypothetical protein